MSPRRPDGQGRLTCARAVAVAVCSPRVAAGRRWPAACGGERGAACATNADGRHRVRAGRSARPRPTVDGRAARRRPPTTSPPHRGQGGGASTSGAPGARPCRAEADDLETTYQATKASGVDFLGINIRDDRDQAKAFAAGPGHVPEPLRPERPARARLRRPAEHHPVHDRPRPEGRIAVVIRGAVRQDGAAADRRADRRRGGRLMGETFAELASSGPLLLAIGAAALAGLVSFLSPCVLPLVPGYLSYVTGLAGADLDAARWRPGPPAAASPWRSDPAADPRPGARRHGAVRRRLHGRLHAPRRSCSPSIGRALLRPTSARSRSSSAC